MTKLKLFLRLLMFSACFILGSCEKSGPQNNNGHPPIEQPENKGFDSDYVFYQNDKTLVSKLFYLLIAIENNDTKKLIIDNQPLQTIKSKYDKLFNEFSWSKYSDLPALGHSLLLRQDDISIVEKEFEKMSEHTSFVYVINNHVRPSGKYEHYRDLNNQYLVRAIWKESIVKGLNTIISQYLIGVKPKYESDGLKYELSSPVYKQKISDEIELINKESDSKLFYNKLMSFAIKLLEMNNRNEAIRFEPLHSGENKAAITHLSQIKWDEYSHASILLLGDSPNSSGDAVNLSESAKVRIQYAVDAYNAKLAPVIIISGANIYPYQTPFFEAVEMKKRMMEKHGIDEKYIIIDPVARHTFSNLRNGSRLIFKYRIPSNRKSLIITTKAQNDIIATPEFSQRCIRELGYMPVKLGERISEQRLEFTPLVISLHTNTMDPLDP